MIDSCVLSLCLSVTLPVHTVHHNYMYCHSTMYYQKAFVQVCVHTALLIANWCWGAGMLSPGPCLFSSSSSSSSFLLGISAIWFKWASLQLASLQLWHFMNCCTTHWRLSHNHPLAFCLPEKFFCLFCPQMISSSQRKRIASLAAPPWKRSVFLHLNLLFLMLDRFVLQRTAVKQINLQRFDLTSVKCLFRLKYLPEFFIDEETSALSLCLLFTRLLCIILSWCAFLFPKGNVLDFRHQSFVGFSRKPLSVWDPQPAW